MRSNSPPNGTLEYLFNELNQRAENSFQALKQHHQKIAELTQTSAGLREENQQLQDRCASLDQALADSQAALQSAQEAALQAAVADADADKEELHRLQDALRTSQSEVARLEEENTELAEANALLTSELSGVNEDKQQLKQRLDDVQQRLKSLVDGALVDSSEAIRSLIRETLDPSDWPQTMAVQPEAEEDAPQVPETFDAKAIMAQWSKRYPKAFSSVSIQPLKIGIHEDLAEREALPDHWIRRVLAGYVRSPRYLRVLKTGAVRMDLTGNNAGFVTEDEAEHAQAQLETIRQQRLEKEKAMREKEEQKRLNSKLSQLLTKK